MNGHCFARRRSNYLTIIYKVKKKAKIRNRFNQTQHLTQDTVWESDKNTRKKSHTREPRGQPFQTGDHKAARNRHGKQTHTKITNKTDQVSKNQMHSTLIWIFAVGIFQLVPLSGYQLICERSNVYLYPLYTNGYFLQVWYNKLRIVHYT